MTGPDLTNPRVRTTLWIIGSVGAVALVIGAIVLTTGIYQLVESVRQTQVDNTAKNDVDRERDKRTAATATDAATAAARIEECTTPGEACFEESQRRLAKTVGSINDYALAAAYCADVPGAQTVVELESCIRAQVTRKRSAEE